MSDDDHSRLDDGNGQDGDADCVMEAEPGNYSLRASGTVRAQGSVSMLVYSHYAEDWWTDACREVPASDADEGEIRHSMRRQIVFAVCALESWFFEWVRDDLLGQVRRAAVIFTPPPKQNAGVRIRRIAKRLHREGELPNEPAFDSPDWQELPRLIRHRDGLVHGVASLPRGDVPEEAQKAMPTPKELRTWAPSEALMTVRRAVKLVTSFADAEPPDWMEVPDPEG